MAAAARESRSSWLGACSAAIAAALPLGIALFRTGLVPAWREDFALIRNVGLVSPGISALFGLGGGAAGGALGGYGSGTVSALLTQVLLLVPVGPLSFRAALVAAVGASAASLVLFFVVERALLANVATPRLAPILAAIAALTATLSPAWQTEATVAGGATVAGALTLSVLALTLVPLPKSGPLANDFRLMLAAGALSGAAFMENATAGILAVVALAAETLVWRALPRRRAVALFFAGAALVIFTLALGWIGRPSRETVGPDLGHTLRTSGLIRLALAPTALGAWRHDVGPLALALSAAGALVGILRRRMRFIVIPLGLWLLADVAFPSAQTGAFAVEPFAVMRLLATAALAVLVALSVQTAVTTLLYARLPMSRAAAVLLVGFDLTLVTMTQEEASFAADRSAVFGAEAWTDEAVEHLPARAALLLRSRELMLRVWSARLVEGVRPDLLLVPLPELGESAVAARVLRKEPAVVPLIRDMSVSGMLTENALTILADARPVEAELDPAWDRRIDSHLVADRLWMRFAPEPLGASDRKLAFAAARPSLARVREVAHVGMDEPIGTSADLATTAVVVAHLRSTAMAAAMLGDREEAVRALEQLTTLASGDPFVADLTQRLAAAKAGPIDVKHLLGN